jgi:PadR family transcriptional regulator, regulatory protein PadR
MTDNWREQLRRGTLDLAVLLVIAPAPRYGLDILKRLEFTDLVLTEGTIYPLLARLEREGVLAAEWVEGEGPRARKYYTLTARGRRRLSEMRDEFRAVTAKIERLLAAVDGD